MNASVLAQLGIVDGARVKVRQGRGESVLAASADPNVPAGVVRIAAAHVSTCGLEACPGRSPWNPQRDHPGHLYGAGASVAGVGVADRVERWSRSSSFPCR